MKTLIDKVIDSIKAIGVPVYYGDGYDLNEMYDHADFSTYPVYAYIMQAASGSLTYENGEWRERNQFVVGFATATHFDACSEDNERLIQDCKECAIKWLISFESHRGELALRGVNGTERFYHWNDEDLTGFAVNVTIEELQGMSKCDT